MGSKRILLGVLLLVLLVGMFVRPGIQLAGVATERLVNGRFEDGFYATPVGQVGNDWGWFHNNGRVTFGMYDDTWAPVVYDGQHSQLIETNTLSRSVSDPDRHAGIYQTVAVVPGNHYELSLHGMLRALEDDPDRSGYNYRVQYGVDYDGGSDWQAVAEWIEIPWDTVHPRLDPGDMESYTATLTATGEKLTLFIRVWKKWGTTSRELEVNLDGISLKGAMPETTVRPTVDFFLPTYPVAGWSYKIPVEAHSEIGILSLELSDGSTQLGWLQYEVGPLDLSPEFAWTPTTAGSHTLIATVLDASGGLENKKVTVVVREEGQFLANGDFEDGFYMGPHGEVGEGWGWFHNGGEATYGFYDDTWTRVVHDGQHSQLIEVNTLGQGGSDPDRFAGIYQRVSGLVEGATYRLSLHGMIRALSDDADPEDYAYRVEWGYDPYFSNNWAVVENWSEIPWDTVHPRLDPGEMSSYTAEFEAQGNTISIFVRVWKKWGTASRELDVNLDGITLTGPTALPK